MPSNFKISNFQLWLRLKGCQTMMMENNVPHGNTSYTAVALPSADADAGGPPPDTDEAAADTAVVVDDGMHTSSITTTRQQCEVECQSKSCVYHESCDTTNSHK